MRRINIALLCFLTTATLSYGQKNKEVVAIPDLPMDAITGLYSYADVVQMAGVAPDDFYKRALAWANGFYKNPGDVLREKNPEAGTILIKARFRISNEADKKGVVTQAGDVMYTLTFSFKEGRYKYEITNINWQQTSYYPAERWKDTASPSYKPTYSYYLKQTDETVRGLIADFKKKIAQPAAIKSSDW